MRDEIARYVDSLTPEQEDRVLGQKMGPRNYDDACYPRCLVGTACDMRTLDVYATAKISSRINRLLGYEMLTVECAFDRECSDWGPGVEVVAAEIRQRILDNRVRRTLLAGAEPRVSHSAPSLPLTPSPTGQLSGSINGSGCSVGAVEGVCPS